MARIFQKEGGGESHGNLRRNGIAGATQAFLSGIVLFLVYRFVVQIVGVGDLGVWALVAGAATSSGIGNLGLGAASVKFSARWLASRNYPQADQAIVTAFYAAGVSVGLLALLGSVALPPILNVIISEPADYQLSLELLPWALGAFWIHAVAGILAGGLDGWNRIDLRALVITLGLVVFGVSAGALLPAYGILGLVVAQIAQGLVLVVGAWLLLWRLSPTLTVVPVAFSWASLREMLGYGVQFQVISLAQVMTEPLTKALLTAFGGTEMTGIFEMANKLVFQIRALVSSGYQALFPYIANLTETDPGSISVLYGKSLRVVTFLVIFLLPATIIVLPVVSLLWFGRVDSLFVLFGGTIALAWYGNLLTTPSYFTNAGTGALRWNVMGHLIVSVLILVLGWSLGQMMDGYGVVLAFSIALIAGSSATMIQLHTTLGLRWTDVFTRADFYFMLSGVLLAAGYFWGATSETGLNWSGLVWSGASAGGLIALLLLARLHPQAKWILSQVPTGSLRFWRPS